MMENYKIIQVLRTFDKRELRNFGEFVYSPYFNKNEPVKRLFDTFEKYYPGFTNRNLTPEKIFIKVFPKDKYDYHKINNVISDLYKLSERFLAYQHAEQSEYFIERNIFRSLRNKELYKIYEQKHAAYMKELIARRFKDEEFYFYLYEMNDEYLWYATIKKPNTELNILQTEFDHFFRFVLIRMLRFYNLMLHERNQNNVDYKLTMFHEILGYITKEKIEEIPAMLVFRTILLLLHTKDNQYYKELWRLKEKYFNEFKFDDQYLIFIHLYDFAAYMVNFTGDDSYNRDMYVIYKEMIEKRFMTPDNFLFPNFMNVVKISCRVGEYDYADNFIKNFQFSIPESERNNVLEFCYGVMEFSKGNLKNALKHFSKSNFQNFLFKVQVKILLLKIYFKLGMYEQALAMIDTFKHFVAREENLLPEHRISYDSFLNLMLELVRTMEEHNPKEKEFKLQKIAKDAEKIPANPFRIKRWLIDEIKNSS